jgi:hypothetical protein
MRNLFFFIILFTPILGFCQTKEFEWSYGLCDYDGVYDTTILSETQIKDTYDLCYSYGSNLLHRPSTLKAIDSNKLCLNLLEKEYKERLEHINNLNIIKTEEWDSIRQDEISDLDFWYSLSRTYLEGFLNPQILNKNFPYDSCQEYSSILVEGGEKMLDYWKEFVVKVCKNNSDPDKCFKEHYQDKFNTSDKENYARLEIMLYGWWNCMCKYKAYKQGPRPDKHEKFKKIFIKTSEHCMQN